jgi:hypothetical protein
MVKKARQRVDRNGLAGLRRSLAYVAKNGETRRELSR